MSGKQPTTGLAPAQGRMTEEQRLRQSLATTLLDCGVVFLDGPEFIRLMGQLVKLFNEHQQTERNGKER